MLESNAKFKFRSECWIFFKGSDAFPITAAGWIIQLNWSNAILNEAEGTDSCWIVIIEFLSREMNVFNAMTLHSWLKFPHWIFQERCPSMAAAKVRKQLGPPLHEVTTSLNGTKNLITFHHVQSIAFNQIRILKLIENCKFLWPILPAQLRVKWDEKLVSFSPCSIVCIRSDPDFHANLKMLIFCNPFNWWFGQLNGPGAAVAVTGTGPSFAPAIPMISRVGPVN